MRTTHPAYGRFVRDFASSFANLVLLDDFELISSAAFDAGLEAGRLDATKPKTTHEIASEIKANAALLAQLHSDDERRALEKIAETYGGECWHTGGGIYVAIIPVGEHEAIGVSTEIVMLYRSEKLTDPYEIFWESDSGVEDSIAYLI